MKNLVEQLSQYAAYHRDRRNIATHFVGIPLIVLAVEVLLSRPNLWQTGVTPALLAAVLASLYYLKLDVRLGAVMACLLGLGLGVAQWCAAQATAWWLGAGLGLFVLGWVIQFVGHYFEGRKPAFVDDLMGLIIGPLFVVAEIGFMLGWRQALQRDIEARVGPAVVRQRQAHA